MTELPALTDREHQVLRCWLRGLGQQGIMRELGVSRSTIAGHQRTLLDKLGVQTPLQAVLLVRERDVQRAYEHGYRAGLREGGAA